MQRNIALFLAAFSAVFPACTTEDSPVLGEPIAVRIETGGNVVGPRFSVGNDGLPVLSWMERGESGATLRYAGLAEDGFGLVIDVVTDPNMFVNWADLPSVMAVDSKHWVAHWLRYSADATYAYDVVVSQSFNGGETWGAPVSPHTDGTPTEHGFVSMHREADGVALLWLDGRNTPEDSMTLRAAVLSPEGERSAEQVVDASVCDCCQTDVAVSSGGPIAVYRDRTIDEIRDIYVSRHIDGRWQPGTLLYADNWEIAGCPVNGPSIVASGDHVAVAWFSAANDKPVVRVMASSNGGSTFGAPVEIAAGRLAGYVGLVLLDDQSFAVSWVGRNASGRNTLFLRHVSADSLPESIHAIAEITQLRVFPQLAYQDGSLFLAWTDEIDESRDLKVVRIPFALPR